MDLKTRNNQDGVAPGSQAAAPPSPIVGSAPKEPEPNHRKTIVIAGIIVLALLAIGIVPRMLQQAALTKSAASAKKSAPTVDVIRPTQSGTTGVIDVPGTIEAIEQTAVYARSTGYVSKVLIDIGDTVKAGQTLAVISAPDTDEQTAQGRAQLAQSQAAVTQAMANVEAMQGTMAQQQANLGHAKAAYLQAKAAAYQNQAQLAQAQFQYRQQVQALAEQAQNTDLAKITNEREQSLYDQGAVPKQSADQDEAAYKVAVANLKLNQSSLSASDANIKAFAANVTAGQANAAAAFQDIGVARAQVATSISNLRAAEDNVTAAQATVAANQAALAPLWTSKVTRM